MPDDTSARRHLPLSPQVFQILLSVLDEPKHGYAIITDIRERTQDEVRLTASTLYDALARLVDHALIGEVEGASADEGARESSRRRYYAATPLGREVAELEARRLERVIAMARDKRLLSTRDR